MERLVIWRTLMGCPVGQMMLRKGYPPARTLKLWLYYFSWEKFHFNKERLSVVFFKKMFISFYFFVYFGCAETLAVCVTAHGLCFSCSEQSLFFIDHRFLVMVESLLRSTGSGIVAHEPSCLKAYGIFPDQGSNLSSCFGRWIFNCCTIAEVPTLS